MDGTRYVVRIVVDEETYEEETKSWGFDHLAYVTNRFFVSDSLDKAQGEAERVRVLAEIPADQEAENG